MTVHCVPRPRRPLLAAPSLALGRSHQRQGAPVTSRLGFVGLGIMGAPMANNLRKTGYPITVWTRTASHVEHLARKGARVAAPVVEAVREWRPGTPEETLMEIVLYRSELGPGGARHEPLVRHALSGTAR